jgi:hypothetical protein
MDDLIEEAIKNGNYRLAVRWCFLKSLQLLNQKQQIVWQPAKTNIDYHDELQNKNTRDNFGKLSHVFEYVWYGEMAANENLLRNYRSEIDKFNTSVHA